MEIKEMFQNQIIKQMSVFSTILGLLLGVLTIIPFIGQFAFFALIVLSTPIVFVYMKKLEMIGIMDIKQGAIYGSIIGFVAFIAFCISFMPLAVIISFISKGSHYLWAGLLIKNGFFILIMLILFVSVLVALMNAFSGLVTMYIYNQIEQKPIESQTDINIEE